MIKLEDIGNFKTVPQLVNDIINGNISELEAVLAEGWDVNEKIKIGKYTELLPIDYALIMENFESVKWLIAHNADLNQKEDSAFLTAVRYCKECIVRCVVEHGAKVNMEHKVGGEAYQQALYGRNFEILPVIHELGHTVEKYGGASFRSAVWDAAKVNGRLVIVDGKVIPNDPTTRDYTVLDFFISHGVDINYHKSDSVFHDSETPVCVAVRYVDLHMVKYLVEHGADITIKTKSGMRPYSIAVEKGDVEMSAYLKQLEPADFHSLNTKLDELKSYKLPKNLMDFLQGDNLHLELGDDYDITNIDFFPLIDTVEMKVGRQKLLRISKAMSDYEHILICWNPKTKKIAYYDMEHDELANMCKFEEFMQQPAVCLENIILGKYTE